MGERVEARKAHEMWSGEPYIKPGEPMWSAAFIIHRAVQHFENNPCLTPPSWLPDAHQWLEQHWPRLQVQRRRT